MYVCVYLGALVMATITRFNDVYCFVLNVPNAIDACKRLKIMIEIIKFMFPYNVHNLQINLYMAIYRYLCLIPTSPHRGLHNISILNIHLQNKMIISV